MSRSLVSVPKGTNSNVEMLEAALRYAAKGRKVFPLHTPDANGACSCGRADCGSVGKHPRTPNGFHDATVDEAQIREWWAMWPDANIGIATGKESGFFVLDVDGMKPGLRLWALQQGEEEILPYLSTLRAATGRERGFHYLFAYPNDGQGVPSSTSRVEKGVDVKGDGGYIVAPPSLHASGRRYRWTNEEEPLPPALWLLRRVRKTDKPTAPIVSSASALIPQGRRNATLAQLAGAIRRVGFPTGAIAAALCDVNKTQCAPPLPETEVIAIAESIGRYPVAAPVAVPALLRFWTAREIGEMTPEITPWVAKPWFAEGVITEVDGKIKSAGKTTWLTHVGRAVLDGDPFMGEPTQKSPVMFLSEQSKTSFREALRRAGLLNRDDFHTVFLHECVRQNFASIMKDTISKTVDLGAKLIIVDTLARWAGLRGDMENSAGDAAEAVAPLKEAAAIHGLAVAFARHERKSGGAVGDSGRGSSAIGGEVDIILSIRRPTGGYGSNVRSIEALSRFDETPESLLVELIEGVGYVPHAASLAVKKDETVEKLLEVLPFDAVAAKPMKQLETETGEARTTLQRGIEGLVAAGTVAQRREPSPTSPILYWRTGEASAEPDTEE